MKKRRTRRVLNFLDDEAKGSDESSSEEDDVPTQEDLNFIDDSMVDDYDLENDAEYMDLITAARNRNRK